MRRAFLFILAAVWLVPANAFATQQSATWKAGVSKVVITPKNLMWMSGYASRNKPAEGKLHDLWAKALMLVDPAGKKHVIVTLDLIGIPRDLSVDLCKQITERHDIPRSSIVISTSHTHTGPVVRSNLNVMYDLSPMQQKYLVDYGKKVEKDILHAVDQAAKDLSAASLSWGIGKATFAVNRRNNAASEVPKLRELGQLRGPFDHDVPVLAVRGTKGKLRTVVFGYACHATVLSFYQWSGDYPGFAQIHLEKAHPGAVAMFWAGCGGDQNPLPRRKVSLADKYGKQLADAVNRVLMSNMKQIEQPIQTRYAEIKLPFSELPTREKLVAESFSKNKYVARRAKMLLEELEKEGELRGAYPYPVQTWKLGKEVVWVILGGEVVVDYAIRLKKEIGPEHTWVMGYANDVMAYIPSLRVLKEGGYEGGGAMVYYGLPTVWSPRVEEMIVERVHRQVKALK